MTHKTVESVRMEKSRKLLDLLRIRQASLFPVSRPSERTKKMTQTEVLRGHLRKESHLKRLAKMASSEETNYEKGDFLP